MSGNWHISTVGSVTVLELETIEQEFGSIGDLQTQLGGFVDQAETADLVMDFHQNEFWNSLFLGMLASLQTKANRRGKRLVLCNLNPKSLWAIQAARLHTIMEIAEDQERALATLAAPKSE